MTYWLNGEFRNDEHAIDIADRGFLLGDGVFETILVHDATPAFLSEHLARMQSGLDALRLDIGAPPDWRRVIVELAKRNALSDGVASARLTVSRGVAPRGLALPAPGDMRPTVLLTLAPVSQNPPEEPLRLMASTFKRAETSLAARHKVSGYLDNIMALDEARRAGFDDAVMLNAHGRVACASSANIFIITPKGVATPALEEGALAGIVRGALLNGARELAFDADERPVAPEELTEGAPFLTNSLIGLRRAEAPGGAAPDAVQQEIFNTLSAWYQSRLRQDLEQNSIAP